MAAHQAPPSWGFSRQEHWSGLPFPSPMHKSESDVAQLCPTLSDPMDCSLLGSSVHGIFQARVLEWGAIAVSDFFLTYSHSCLLGLQRYVYLTLHFFPTNNQNLFTFKKHFCFPSRSGFLYPRTIDVLGQIISCPV